MNFASADGVRRMFAAVYVLHLMTVCSSSSFNNYLKKEGIYEEVIGHAIKRVIAWQLVEAMKAKKISKAEMARRLKTRSIQVARFLDPEISGLQLDTIQKAAAIVGKRLVDHGPRAGISTISYGTWQTAHGRHRIWTS